MIRHLLRTSIFAFALAVGIVPAAAQSDNCGPRQRLVDVLSAQYGETQRGLGLSSEQAALELYVGPTGTWTLVATFAAGNSCVLATGIDWHDIAIPGWHSSAFRRIVEPAESTR